jgi:hypothetical protein
MSAGNAAVMHLSHLGLPVHDELLNGVASGSIQPISASCRHFDPASAQEYENSTVIVCNADGFHLVLYPPGHVEPPPALGVGQFPGP